MKKDVQWTYNMAHRLTGLIKTSYLRPLEERCPLRLMPDSGLNSNVWKLNQKQGKLFDIVHSWAKNVLKIDH